VLIVLRGSRRRRRWRSRSWSWRHCRRDWQADWGYASRFSKRKTPCCWILCWGGCNQRIAWALTVDPT